MSDAIAFDTHRFVRNLTQSGFTGKQAAIQTARADLLKWILTAIIARGGLVVALIKPL